MSDRIVVRYGLMLSRDKKYYRHTSRLVRVAVANRNTAHYVLGELLFQSNVRSLVDVPHSEVRTFQEFAEFAVLEISSRHTTSQ